MGSCHFYFSEPRSRPRTAAISRGVGLQSLPGLGPWVLFASRPTKQSQWLWLWHHSTRSLLGAWAGLLPWVLAQSENGLVWGVEWNIYNIYKLLKLLRLFRLHPSSSGYQTTPKQTYKQLSTLSSYHIYNYIQFYPWYSPPFHIYYLSECSLLTSIRALWYSMWRPSSSLPVPLAINLGTTCLGLTSMGSCVRD